MKTHKTKRAYSVRCKCKSGTMGWRTRRGYDVIAFTASTLGGPEELTLAEMKDLVIA